MICKIKLVEYDKNFLYNVIRYNLLYCLLCFRKAVINTKVNLQ